MPDMTPLTDILNGNPGSAIPVEGNFQTIEDYVNGTEFVRTDGTEVMTANLDMGGFRITNSAIGLVYHGTGVQLAPGPGGVDLTIDVEVFDIGTVSAVGSAVLTIPSTGLYAAVIEASATSVTSISLRRAGPPFMTFGDMSPSTTVEQMGGHPRYLTSGQTLTLRGAEFSNSGGTITFDVKLYRIA